MIHRILSEVVRRERPTVLAALMARCGDFDLAEDAFQEACLRGHVSWLESGLPEKPGAWLYTAARRCMIDGLRRRNRLSLLTEQMAEAPPAAAPPNSRDPEEVPDERLRLIFICCHPALPPSAQVALALRHICGLSTREIARAFIEPEATTAQRLSRTKKKIGAAGIPYRVPAGEDLLARTNGVLSTIYLLFNEGYASTDADSWLRPDLTGEAIRMGRLVVEILPQCAEARALLALMIFHHSRRDARVSATGEFVPLEDQDRIQWHREEIDFALSELERATAILPVGFYQIQAMIAALHATAERAAETDWRQIALLYGALLEIDPSPIIQLNAAVACAFAFGFGVGLTWLARLEQSGELAGYYFLPAAQAELLRRLGRLKEAVAAYDRALAMAISQTERNYLLKQRRDTDGLLKPV